MNSYRVIAMSTYAALQGSPIDVVAGELTDCHGSVLVAVHLDEREATVGLEPGLNHISKVLEQGNKVVLSGVRGEIADVDGGLPLGGLLDDHIVALDAVCGEVVMPVRSSRSHSHGSHGSLLRNRRLALLVGPVATDRPRPEPFAFHSGESLLGVDALTEGNETVSTRAAGLHVPHDAGLGNGPKGGESLQKNLIVDFIREISNKDMEVVAGILLVLLVGLICPVDADFLIWN